MNTYEQKQAEKKERLARAAESRRAKADKLSKEGWDALGQIPFGQPILVGHHSEKSDRAYRGRAVGKIDRAVTLEHEADDLERRAESVGTGGISSDDPDAIKKLEEKLDTLTRAHEKMVAANKYAKSNFAEKPFEAYQISNSGANIRSVKQRIEGLRKKESTPCMQPVFGACWKMRESTENNRFMFIFETTPDEEVRTLLKHNGFKWAYTSHAWVRQISPNARYATLKIIEKLHEYDSN